MRITHRGLPALLAATVGLVPLSLAVTALSVAPANAAPTDIKINEIITNSATAPDSIELTNIGAEAVDVSGWILKDDNDTRTLAIAGGTSIAPGAFLAVPVAGDGGFGLGNGDAARVYLADGTTLVDGHTFPSHSAPSWSRCPDGTGAFVQANAETLGAANDCPGVEDLVINEVESNGDPVGDWIELANPTGLAIDATGLVVKDSDDSRTLTVPADTVVPAGGYASVYTEPADDPAGFGLGGADSARIFTADGTTLIDSYSWEAHAATSYGRCPDRTGDFGATLATTRGAANDCPVPSGADDLVINEISSNPFDFVELKNVSDGPVELSGLKVADNSAAPITITTESTTLEPGALYSFSPDALPGGFGLGSSDTATIYLADGVTVVDSYAWVGHRIPSYGICPGSDELVENAAASPGAANVCQPIRVNEVESSGGEPGDWIELVNATGFPHVMDVTFDREQQRIWAACDDTCDGQVSVLEIGADGHLAVDTGYDRPTGMPDLNNEGFAIAPQSTCTDGFKQVLWSDDGGTGGHSLRAGTLPCTATVDPTPVANTALPTISGKAKVGWTLTGTDGTWTPTPATTTYQWLANGAPISGATSTKLKVGPSLVGKAITFRVTVSADGFLDATATSAATAKVTRAPFAFAKGPRIAGTPKVGKVLTARIGTLAPSPTSVRYHWLVDGRRIPGATGAQVRLLQRWAGHRITVKVRYVRAGYETRTVTTSGVRVSR